MPAPPARTTSAWPSATYDNASGLNLSVIAAVLLGGIDFDGGRGTLGGAVAGVFLLGTLQNLLSLDNVSADSQTVVTGLLLIVILTGEVGQTRLRNALFVRRAA